MISLTAPVFRELADGAIALVADQLLDSSHVQNNGLGPFQSTHFHANLSIEEAFEPAVPRQRLGDDHAFNAAGIIHIDRHRTRLVWRGRDAQGAIA